ncbi:MAG: adenosylmethionine--8-amino-7-oxononanoate transaminase, partial [Gammaproteobacteria bacterium]
PEGLEHVFLADSGSVSVEVAIKMAMQYWQAQGQPERNRLLTIRHGYHGDTFGAMSVCDPVSGMHHLFSGMLPQHLFARAPANVTEGAWDASQLDDFAAKMEAHQSEIAAVILEPIVQGAGGMRVYHPEFLAGVRRLCDAHGVLLIVDEIATGFGRTGTMFACEQAGVSPDIMCVGKALTGGYMTLAAVLCSRRVAEGVEAGGHVLMHGPTFMGNPLACAVALASIEKLLAYDWQRKVRAIEEQLTRELEPCRGLANVADVRVKGAIGVLEMKQPVDVPAVQKRLMAQGVWLRPFGRLIYAMPPYVITAGELSAVISAMRRVAAADQGCA